MRTRPIVRSGVTAATLLLLSGCGASAGQLGTTGIDTLTVPTSSPDPGDFVAGVDNPWFDLAPGTVWRYRNTTMPATGETRSIIVTVLDEPGSIAGVPTTRVSTSTRSRTGENSVIDDFAQDRDGNVWWFAREGLWQVGSESADATPSTGPGAGLFWPAEPRLGDGWSQVDVLAQVEQNIEVSARQVSLATPVGEWSEAVESTTTLPLRPSESGSRTWWVEGVGPVRMETATGGVLDLVEHTRP